MAEPEAVKPAVISRSSAAAPNNLAIYPCQEPPPARTLLDILAASVAAHPTAPAIDAATSSRAPSFLTYAELAERVDGLAVRLGDAGIGTRGPSADRVGIRVASGTADLYIGILAILRAGAAYVPVDVDDPDDRADLVWSEAGVRAVLTDNNTITPFRHDTTPRHSSDAHQPSPSSSAALPSPPSLDRDAWIIFTSGSTGKPKGVAVTHRSAAALVDAESDFFLPGHRPLCPGDRVLAGLSVAFDASCEEMWLAWRHGACLVPAPRRLVKAGAELGAFLVAQRITVASTVPTLAALWPVEALRGLRLLILGGEACAPELATRLVGAVSGPVWNTYGPTEATVISCGAQLQAAGSDSPSAGSGGSPMVVRIGLPLAGWHLAVVNPESGQPVRWGEVGELIIGGVGTARYLDAEKDRAKFVPSPALGGARAYRSGDVVRADRAGLVFVGRDDEQIKLGGRRIELGEVDAALMTLPGVRGAASAIRRTETGNQVLVGYIVRDDDHSSASDRDLLRKVLPPTLIPMIVRVDIIPVRTSGKVDRKALPWPPPESASASAANHDSSTMSWVSSQWRAVLGVTGESPESNFFHLGGTSLAAAQLVSQLRRECSTLSVADVYECPTLAAMTARVDQLRGAARNTEYEKAEDEKGASKPGRRRRQPPWAGPVQAVVLVAVFLLEGLRLAAPYTLSQRIFLQELEEQGKAGEPVWARQHDLAWPVVVVLWLVCLTTLGRLLTTALVVRALTAGIRPGTYRRAGLTHLRLWAAERFAEVAHLNAAVGTNWARYYAWFLGCQVGRDVQLHALPPVTGLARFGDGAAIEPEVDLDGWWIDGDRVHIGSVTVGRGARVGARCMLMPGAIVRAHAVVEPGMTVEGVHGTRRESPDALLASASSSSEHGSSRNEPFRPAAGGFSIGVFYTLAIFAYDILHLVPFLPVWGLLVILVDDYSNFRQLSLAFVKMAVPGTAVGLLLYLAVIVVVVRAANLALRPGTHPWHGAAAFSAWLVHLLMTDARETAYPLFASLATPFWFRLLGADMGRNVEAGDIVPLPSLLRVADNAFLADDVLVGCFELGGGKMTLGRVAIGRQTFLGNLSVCEAGIDVPSNSLVGVLGSVPVSSPASPGTGTGTEKQTPMQTASSWLGRAPIPLPPRNTTDADAATVDEYLTLSPPLRLVAARALVESARVVPLLLNGLVLSLGGLSALWIMSHYGLGYAILASAAFLMVCALVAACVTVLAKWSVTPPLARDFGRTHPLWSFFVWRNELVDAFTQSLAQPLLLQYARGTPLMALFFRCLGARVGRAVWIESHLLPEPDLCALGDDAVVNRGAVMQTHLFHDRLLRMAGVTLEEGATLGPHAVALPDTVVGAETAVYPVSLVMRGERLPERTRWKGNPVRPWVGGKDVVGVEDGGWDDPSAV